ncbi:unnamed protein product [Phytophthora fragariaefolia]|uniref:Unnamed protein product n=1 Tax=Phytophthora fragariaefolia TaxID=1490495 RepID=A0A9W6XPK4_9STRA|nr:unnamed protein product [Phytophthora fragariaefolia]
MLSHRPDYELAHITTATSSIPDRICASYSSDDMCVAPLKAFGFKEFENPDKELSARLRARLHCYAFDGGMLYFSTGSDDPPYPMTRIPSTASSTRHTTPRSVGYLG